MNPQTLIVEDNPVNQRLMELMLRHLGLPCTVVNNGAEACRAVQQGRYQLVLMDIDMPVMNGIEATRAIRADHALTRQPVIVAVTASEASETLCRDAGMNGYIAKPVELRKLRRILHEVIGLPQVFASA